MTFGSGISSPRSLVPPKRSNGQRRKRSERRCTPPRSRTVGVGRPGRLVIGLTTRSCPARPSIPTVRRSRYGSLCFTGHRFAHHTTRWWWWDGRCVDIPTILVWWWRKGKAPVPTSGDVYAAQAAKARAVIDSAKLGNPTRRGEVAQCATDVTRWANDPASKVRFPLR